MKVYVHLANGFEEIEATTVIDVLRRAEIDVETVSITGDLLVTGAHGVGVKADKLIDDVNYDSGDMIVLPGGMPGTTNLGNCSKLIEQVKKYNDQKKWVGAICAAPMILGENGLLEGKTAVIYPGMEEHLKGAELGNNKVEVDGNIITSKGPGTAMDFALKLVEVLKDKDAVNKLKEEMLLS
ncbi:MAG: DJ-1/PfpI family protein [Clostridiales bacterium]|nr:DJ-1/PfpI family protein [Clostridiales bacterium]